MSTTLFASQQISESHRNTKKENSDLLAMPNTSEVYKPMGNKSLHNI
jgi:hypothetical protein